MRPDYERMTREQIIEHCEMYRRQLGGRNANRMSRPKKKRKKVRDAG